MTFHHRGYDIPTNVALKSAINPGNFSDGEMHLSYLRSVVGIKPHHNILEIGCAVGRIAIPLTATLSSSGSYLGVDIVPDAIEWCKTNITSKYENFQFQHFDIKDGHHNPSGLLPTSSVVLPVEDHSIDRIIVWAVFTHLFADDVEHYFREFSRVLKSDGLALVTCHLINKDILARLKEWGDNLTFEHPYGDGCYINNPEYPWREVAYEEEKMLQMVSRSGLKYDRELLPGPSRPRSNHPRDAFKVGFEQDVIVLRRA